MYIYIYDICIYIFPSFFNVPSDSGVSREAFWMFFWGNLPSGGCCSPAGSGQAAQPGGDSSGALDATGSTVMAWKNTRHPKPCRKYLGYIYIYTCIYIYIYGGPPWRLPFWHIHQMVGSKGGYLTYTLRVLYIYIAKGIIYIYIAKGTIYIYILIV